MSDVSENPVQNKVVKAAIDDAIGSVDTFPSNETGLDLYKEETLNTMWTKIAFEGLGETISSLPSDSGLQEIYQLLVAENQLLDLIYRELERREE